MKRCIDSGLWVPNAKGDDGEEKGDEKDDEPTYEEIQHEKEEAKKEWPHLNCDLFLIFLANVTPLYFNFTMCMFSLPTNDTTSQKYLADI